MTLHIVTDSDSCLSEQIASNPGLSVVPVKASVDGVFFRDFTEIGPDEFYAKQKSGAKCGTTQPGPEDFVSVYTRLLQSPDDEILSIHVSSAMSSTLSSSAYVASQQVDPGRIHLYDSRTIGLGQGFMVMSALRMAERGADLDSIVKMLDGMQPRIHIYFLVETMKYLIEGGRIGKAAGVAASILQIKPILTVKDGIIDVFDRPRTIKKARNRIQMLIDGAVARGIESIGFHYAGNRPEVEAVRLEFSARTGIPATLSQVGAGVGCHTGPETMGVVIVDKLD
ncbi:MAG: DegV family protein [Candidatus Cryosericum sp.]